MNRRTLFNSLRTFTYKDTTCTKRISFFIHVFAHRHFDSTSHSFLCNQKTERMELSNQEKIKTEKRKLGNIGNGHHETSGDERKIQKNTSEERENNSKPNYIAEISSKWRTVPLVRYLGPFLKWTREELRQMDRRIRKLMTLYKALHPTDDIDRLYLSRKEGGRRYAMMTRRLHKKSKERLIAITGNNSNNIRIYRKQ